MTDGTDRWHRWLLDVRFGGDTATREAMSQVLSPRETAEFSAHLRPLVESGTGLDRRALAYLTAIKN